MPLPQDGMTSSGGSRSGLEIGLLVGGVISRANGLFVGVDVILLVGEDVVIVGLLVGVGVILLVGEDVIIVGS